MPLVAEQSADSVAEAEYFPVPQMVTEPSAVYVHVTDNRWEIRKLSNSINSQDKSQYNAYQLRHK